MRITRENYERYFVDYLDGNLSDLEIEMLENFLFHNADLRNELEGLEKIRLNPEKLTFTDKELLIKPDLTLPVSDSNFEDFCIAFTEGDLDEFLTLKFNDYCRTHPEKMDIYLLYKQLHLRPDYSIQFPIKDKLKKLPVVSSGRIMFVTLTVAATIIFFLLIIRKQETINVQSEKQETAVFLQKENNFPEKNTYQESKPATEKDETDPGKHQIKEVPFINSSLPPQKNERILLAAVPSFDQHNKLATAFSLHPDPKIGMPITLLTEKDVLLPSHIFNLPSLEKSKSSEYLSVDEFATKELNNKILGKPEESGSKPSVWDIAGAGINGINRLTGSDMKLEKTNDSEGTGKKIIFESKVFSLYSSME